MYNPELSRACKAAELKQIGKDLERLNLCPSNLAELMITVALAPSKADLGSHDELVNHIISVMMQDLPKVKAQDGMQCRATNGKTFTLAVNLPTDTITYYKHSYGGFTPTRATVPLDFLEEILQLMEIYS